MRRLLLTPVFDDLKKRSLLARIVKLYPEMQAMITGEAGEKEETLTVSWASLEKRKEEYEDLVNRQIPQNTKDIATARSYGDLRENFEFKSAKEQQRVLMRRRAEAERNLSRARGTNFENRDTSQVLHSGRVGQRVPIGNHLLQSSHRTSTPGQAARRECRIAYRKRNSQRHHRPHRSLHKFGRSSREGSPAFRADHLLNRPRSRNLLATGRAKSVSGTHRLYPTHCHVRYPHHNRHRPPNH
jgi:hypothetical protein